MKADWQLLSRTSSTTEHYASLSQISLNVNCLEAELSAEASLAASPGPCVWMTSLPTSYAALIALISRGGGRSLNSSCHWIITHTC